MFIFYAFGKTIVDKKKLDAISSAAFAVDHFFGLFFNPSSFLTKDSQSAKNNSWCFLIYTVLIKVT